MNRLKKREAEAEQSKLIYENLRCSQDKVRHLPSQGYTQSEIAKTLQVSQPSTTSISSAFSFSQFTRCRCRYYEEETIKLFS
jgi:hypothetical protein